MKTGNRKSVLAICSILFLNTTVSALKAVYASSSSRVAFRFVRNYLVVVPVRVNGLGPFDFMLDTGTNTTIITPELARQLNLRPIDHITLVTLAGSVVAPRATLDSVQVGAETTKHLEVICDELQGVRQADSKGRGVLGQNFLSRFNYLLNYTGRYVELEDGGELAHHLLGDSLQVEQQQGKPIVASQATTSSSGTLRLVLDSGTSDLVIFASACQRVGLNPRDGVWLTATSGQGTFVNLTRLQALQVGSEHLTGLWAALVKNSAEGRSEDGLLPTHLFQRVFFQNDRHIVILNPRDV